MGLMNCMSGGGQVDHSQEEWKALKSRVAELELQLEEAKKGSRQLSRSNSASSVGSFGERRRSSLAKLESLQETSDEATQKFITSQVRECTASAARNGGSARFARLSFFASLFIHGLPAHASCRTAPAPDCCAPFSHGNVRRPQYLNDEATDGETGQGLKKFRHGATAIMAAARLGKAASAAAAAVLPPVNATVSVKPPEAAVPSRHMPEAPTQAQLDLIVSTNKQMAAADWECDVIPLCAILKAPMTYIVSTILRSWNAASLFSVDEATLVKLLEKIEFGYLSTNPYHNATHAADVAYSTYVMLTKGVREALHLTDLQCAVCVLAAAAHDFRHPGIGANYLIAMSDDLAILYNDKSPLESMHTAEFFKLLKQNPSLDVFAKLEPKQRADSRKAVIGMIMATDMSVHFDYLDKFIKRFPPANAVAEDDCEPLPSTDYTVEDQNFAMAMLLHCADISNPAKPTAAYTDWTDRVLAEFYGQGDKEKAAGIPISPLFDRTQPSISKMQTGFMQFIVRPIFSAWCDFVPALQKITVPHLDANQALWKAETPYVPPDQPFVHAEKTDWDWDRGCWK